jgi:hypothetical protein
MARGSKTKKWQIEAKPTWRHFKGKMRLVWTQKRAQKEKEREGPHAHEGIQLSSYSTPITPNHW